MSDYEWSKVQFQEFVDEFGKEVVIENAPVILYSKKDKEHEAFNSLVAFFFIAGFLLIYISVSYFLASLFFNIVLFIAIIVVFVIADIFLILNVIKSNVYIKPLECWIEIYKGKAENSSNLYCFNYYPIFSGKCHPNKVKNIVFKIYQEQILKSKIDITQIEFYLKIDKEDSNKIEKLGYFFQYAEGRPFKDEKINRNTWKYFPYERSGIENYIAVGNWDHQYEWRNDLEFDFDKLHEYAPWVIQRWSDSNIKTLTEENKEKINWDLRNIESTPKLKPWIGNLGMQSYENLRAHKDLEIIDEAINKIVGSNRKVEKVKEIKDDISMFKSYFRDLEF
ncbi:MAG: hypothetical protein ACFE9Z_11800 [Promethearchaeota archaeon]